MEPNFSADPETPTLHIGMTESMNGECKKLKCFSFYHTGYANVNIGSSVVQWLGRRTCDQEITSSIHGLCIAG